jgi:hypothetical protein
MRGKYLARHAEPEAAFAAAAEGTWDHVVVVPACAEPSDALAGLSPACAGRRVLGIVVVNGRGEHEAAVHGMNEALLAALIRGGDALASGLWLVRGEPDLLVVDRASEGRRFGPKDGVGLARKIGCDLALGLGERVGSRWIHMTDADVRLGPAYFDAAPDEAQQASAFVRHFEHVPSGDVAIDDAHIRYELSLRYYVLGLRWAGSPYAFHTVGSTLGVDARANAGVRGVPRRQAGEDFYLLNKLAKLGPVVRVDREPVRIMSRASSRVPFGTGPAVRRLLGRAEGPDVYAPESFVALRAWMGVLGRAGEGEGGWDERELDALPSPIREALESGLDRLGARSALTELHRRHTGAARARQLHAWFDGFRTLKLVHALRDSGLADLPWREAFGRAPFLAGLDASADAAAVRADLIERELGS